MAANRVATAYRTNIEQKANGCRTKPEQIGALNEIRWP